jgi:hypothetical protein
MFRIIRQLLFIAHMKYNQGMFTLETSPTALLPFLRDAIKEFSIPSIAKDVTLELLMNVRAVSFIFYRGYLIYVFIF